MSKRCVSIHSGPEKRPVTNGTDVLEGSVVLGHFVTRYSNVTIDVNHRSILADSSSGDRTLFFLTGSAISFSNG